jgi:hypothetical protein
MPPEAVVMLFFLVAAGVSVWALTLRYRRRELEHKERLAALEKGVDLPAITPMEWPALQTSRAYLLRGLVWLFGGIAVSVFLFGISLTTQHPRSVQEKAFLIERLKQVGASESMIRQVETDSTPYQQVPLGLGLLGLVPAGVGLAYLIVYRLEIKSHADR